MEILLQDQRVVFVFSGLLNAWRFRELASFARRWSLAHRMAAWSPSGKYSAAIQIGRRDPIEIFPTTPRWLRPWLA